MKHRSFKQWTVALSAITIMAAVPAITSNAASLWGDANCDNNVNMADVVLIMQSLVNPDKFGINGSETTHITRAGMDNADVEQSGNGITNNDALSIQKYKLNLIRQLPESYSQTTVTQPTTQATTQ